jgi:hypothetical protein
VIKSKVGASISWDGKVFTNSQGCHFQDFLFADIYKFKTLFAGLYSRDTEGLSEQVQLLRSRHNCQSMHVSKLSTLNTELMTIRQARRTTKVQEDIHSPNRLIDDISAIREVLTTWNSNIARVGGCPFSGVRTTFETGTRCSPWDDGGFVLEYVEVSVCCCLDYGAGILFVCCNWIPLEEREISI